MITINEEGFKVSRPELEAHEIGQSELEYIEKSNGESVYHWFYPNNIDQQTAYEISKEVFSIVNPEIDKEEMFDSITIMLDHYDSKDVEKRHKELDAKFA